jgi:SAM-dependent methyltransferase
MPLTAFGRALLAAAQGRPQAVQLSWDGAGPVRHPCGDYLEVRDDEVLLLDEIALPPGAAVLDIGCGLGRHLRHLRRRHPGARLFGVDRCDGLRAHCEQVIPGPARFFATADALPHGQRYDLILLLGNGLGIFGAEANARAGLGRLLDALAPGGCVLLETGQQPGCDYRASAVEIAWRGHRDGPFIWGGGTRAWLRDTVNSLGARCELHPSEAPGRLFFLARVWRAAGGIDP